MKITIKQISHLSGYSISTVSKALNDGQDISDQTKVKIKELAKNYNYVPNSAAKALRNNKTKLVAVIVPYINSTIFSNALSEIQEIASHKGYKVLILQSFSSRKKELKCIYEVINGCVDGIIIYCEDYKKSVNENIILELSHSSNLPIIIKKMDNSNGHEVNDQFLGAKTFELLQTKIEALYN